MVATLLVLMTLLASLHTSAAAVERVAWTGGFSSVVVPNVEPALDDSTSVRFNVSRALNDSSTYGAELRMFDGDTYLGKCNTGMTCSLTADPSPGTSKTYHAEVWVLRAGAWVKFATSESVTVSDPGWTGRFTSAVVQSGNEEFLGAVAATFSWSQPLQYVYVDIVDSSGTVLANCSTPGLLECSVGKALGPGEAEPVHAEVRMTTQGGGVVTVARSETVDLTGMDPDAYANFLLSAPEARLVALLGPSRATQALTIRSVAQSESFCVQVGQAFPGNQLFKSSVPDSALICMGGTAALLTWMIVELGPDGALTGLAGINPDGPDDSNETPQPQPDGPNPPDTPPAAPADTCQVPPGQDPDVFYFYQRNAQAESILDAGVRDVGPQGKIWLASVLYLTAAQAQFELSLPDPPPDGYFEVPRSRLGDLYGPYCVDPDFGQPGGGIEYWTTSEIDMSGLAFHPFQ